MKRNFRMVRIFFFFIVQLKEFSNSANERNLKGGWRGGRPPLATTTEEKGGGGRWRPSIKRKRKFIGQMFS